MDSTALQQERLLLLPPPVTAPALGGLQFSPGLQGVKAALGSSHQCLGAGNWEGAGDTAAIPGKPASPRDQGSASP